jgi:hypothetical protein
MDIHSLMFSRGKTLVAGKPHSTSVQLEVEPTAMCREFHSRNPYNAIISDLDDTD